MTTSLYNLLHDYEIAIPITQRDYAQGRLIGKVPKIRERFLNSIFHTLKADKDPLELDFVYGYTKENIDGAGNGPKSFIPLDGQQRLTTLFLLHWYVAAKENHLDEANKFLKNFTYETRHSSTLFCNKLVDFMPSEFNTPIDSIIIDQPWFFTAWKNDPTISSMLTMLKAIQEKDKLFALQDIWSTLTGFEPKIVFHLLPMEKLGLPDDLYIKMNSRGKELTEFEYFKSQFSEILQKDQAKTFKEQIDQGWSDLFWNLFKDEESADIAKLVDNGFLRFFQYITDILIIKNSIETELLKDDADFYKAIYSDYENVKYLFSCLKVLSEVDTKVFFNNLFYFEEIDFIANKTRLFSKTPELDLFKKCSDKYDPLQRNNPFPIGEQLLLYACIEHLINNNGDINAKIRLLRNLINNSEDTVRKENMKSLLITVSNIINDDCIADDTKFNKRQVAEEENKQRFIQENHSIKETIYRLEDHHLLQGCLSVFELDDTLADYAKFFELIFHPDCDYELISTVMLCKGDYSQKHDWRKRFGNKNDSSWRELLTPSQKRGDFNNLKGILYELFALLKQSPEVKFEDIVSGYISLFDIDKDKPKDWRYYIIKYREFRKSEDGFYYWKDLVNKQYEFIMMRRPTLGGFNWSPFLYTLKARIGNQVSLENYGAPLLLHLKNATIKLLNTNNGYQMSAYDDVSLDVFDEILKLDVVDIDGLCKIAQNDEGTDIDDRIEKGIDLISKISALQI